MLRVSFIIRDGKEYGKILQNHKSDRRKKDFKKLRNILGYEKKFLQDRIYERKQDSFERNEEVWKESYKIVYIRERKIRL